MSYKYVKGRYGPLEKEKRKSPKRFLWVLFVLLGLLAIAGAASPFVARYYLIQYLESKGFTTEIKQLAYNPFSGNMTVVGLELYKNEAEQLKVGRLTGQLGLKALANKSANFGAVTARGVELHYKQNFPSQYILGAHLDDLLSSVPRGWDFKVGSFTLDQAEICRHLHLIRFDPTTQCLSIRNSRINQLVYSRAGDQWDVTAASPITAERVYLQDKETGLSVLYLGQAKVRGVRLAPRMRKVAQIELDNFHLVESSDAEASVVKSRYQSQFGTLKIDNVEYMLGNPSILQVGLVEAESLRQTLHKDRESAFVAVSRLRKFFPSVELALNKESTESDQPAMHMKINNIRFIDGAIAWRDMSTAENVQKRFFGLNMEFGLMDSANPDKPTPLTILAKLDNNGGLSVRGLTYPFADKMKFELHGNIRGLNLASISKYSLEAFGESIDAGNLDAQFDALSDGEEVGVDTLARLENLKIGEGVKERKKKVNFSELYELLRSARGALVFNTEFTYDLHSMESFNKELGDAVHRKLFSQANKNYRSANASAPTKKPNKKKYLMDSVVDGKRAPFAISIEPFYYSTKKTGLADHYDERLEAMIRLMRGKTDLGIDICATSTAGEWSKVYNDGRPLKFQSDMSFNELQNLIGISRSRFKEVKRRLVAAGIEENRIADCRAKVDQTDSGDPYVSISMR